MVQISINTHKATYSATVISSNTWANKPQELYYKSALTVAMLGLRPSGKQYQSSRGEK